MEKRRFSLLMCGAAIVSMAGSITVSAGESVHDLADHLITMAGTSRGLCSLLGCRDGTLALELVKGSRFFLYVQDQRKATVSKAQKTLDVDGFYGTRVLVERKPLHSLPFADNTVDVVLAPLGARPGKNGFGVPFMLKDLSIREIVRTLRPGGRAIAPYL